jgi:hypothetical protein
MLGETGHGPLSSASSPPFPLPASAGRLGGKPKPAEGAGMVAARCKWLCAVLAPAPAAQRCPVRSFLASDAAPRWRRGRDTWGTSACSVRDAGFKQQDVHSVGTGCHPNKASSG